MMGSWGNMMGWWGGGFGIGMILWWIIVIGIIVLAVYGISNLRERKKFSFNKEHPSDPLAILKTRYAKGEITKEEFDRIMQDL